MTKEPDQFTLGYLAAAAVLAREGMDTCAVELCGHCGVTEPKDLHGKGLSLFDKKPLWRVLKAAL